MASEWYNQELALVATIDPVAMSTSGATTSTSTLWTDAVDMDVFEKCVFILMVNTIAASSGVTMTVYGDGASATGGMTVALATGTTLLDADDDEQQIIEIDTEDLDVDGRDRYVRAKVVLAPTAGTAASCSALAVVGLAGHCRYHPASNYDLASVTQITTS